MNEKGKYRIFISWNEYMKNYLIDCSDSIVFCINNNILLRNY